MLKRVIIVHTPEHVSAALEATQELKQPIALQSAPHAIYYAGALYLLEMFRQAQQRFPQTEARFILDCADAGVEAVEALQMGHQLIRSSAPAAIKDKLADIARQCGAELTDAPYEALDLRAVHDPQAACRDWLQKIENLPRAV